jgi:hypothetical protein
VFAVLTEAENDEDDEAIHHPTSEITASYTSNVGVRAVCYIDATLHSLWPRPCDHWSCHGGRGPYTQVQATYATHAIRSLAAPTPERFTPSNASSASG